MSKALSGIVAEHIRAVNAFDTDAIVATFAEDAYVNDNRREIVGIKAVRRWVEKEMVGDKVTIEVREVLVRSQKINPSSGSGAIERICECESRLMKSTNARSGVGTCRRPGRPPSRSRTSWLKTSGRLE